MKRNRITFVIIATVLLATCAAAQKTKDLTAWAGVTSEQAIRLEGFRGADLVVRTWDQPRAEVRLSIGIEMSSESAETEYIQEVRLEQDSSPGSVVFTLHQPSIDIGLTFRNLFKLRFNTYAKKEIRGEVFLPKENAFFADARYGKLDVEGLGGPVEIESRSSLVDVRSCAQLATIQNNYGTTSIVESGGHLTLHNQSGKVDVTNFNGTLDVTARYATVTAEKVTGSVDIESQSGSVTLLQVGSDVVIDAPYSNIVVEEVSGSVSLTSKSGSVRVSSVRALEIDAPYSTVDVQDVKGMPSRKVTITGQSGKISMKAIAASVEIRSPYTNIDLTDIDGDVDLSTKSGNVRASNVKGNWTSRTEYSRLTLQQLSSDRVLIENKSGGVDVGLARTPERVVIVNEYADVNLTIPKGLDAEVRLKAEYGSITSDLPVQVETMGSGALALGKTGTGKGTMNIEAKSGNIRIREK